MTDLELLNWAMHQMLRAARTMQLLAAGADPKSALIYVQGLDLCAAAVEKRLEERGFTDGESDASR